MALAIPHWNKKKDFSLLLNLEHKISPYVAFGIMPLFAFANAGVSLENLSISDYPFDASQYLVHPKYKAH